MDTPTAGHHVLFTFANRFPLYFRAPFLLGLVWLLWGVDLLVFRAFNIPHVKILDFDPATTLSPSKVIGSAVVFMLFIGLVVLGFVNAWPFQDVLLFPSLLYLTLAFALVTPANILHRPGRERLLANFIKVMLPGPSTVPFVEVLLGDVLTSIAKALADLEVTGCVLFAHLVTPPGSEHEPHIGPEPSYSPHERACMDSWMRPMVTSLPFIFRFIQCWTNYRVTKRNAFPHLLNCLKYASALPVIWISAWTQSEGHFSKELRAAWIFAVSFNSFFSFLWDVVMDWGLCRQGARLPLLREHLIFSIALPGTSSSSNAAGGGGDSGTEGQMSGDEDEIEMVQIANNAHNPGPIAQPLSLPSQSQLPSTRPNLVFTSTPPSGNPLSAAAVPARRGPLNAASLMNGGGIPSPVLGGSGGGPSISGGGGGGFDNNLEDEQESNDLLPRHQQRRRAGFGRSNGAQGSSSSLNGDSTSTNSFFAGLSALLGSGAIYYVAMGFNFVLRILWSFKLSVHFQLSQEGLTFFLEVCEVVRRAVWIVFRVEWEAVEKGHMAIPPSPVGASAQVATMAREFGALMVDQGDFASGKKSPRQIGPSLVNPTMMPHSAAPMPQVVVRSNSAFDTIPVSRISASVASAPRPLDWSTPQPNIMHTSPSKDHAMRARRESDRG